MSPSLRFEKEPLCPRHLRLGRSAVGYPRRRRRHDIPTRGGVFGIEWIVVDHDNLS
jgi:hypothetical protein